VAIQEALDYLEGARFANYSGQIIAEHEDKNKDHIVCDLTCTCSEVANKNADEYGEALVTALNAVTALPGLVASCEAAIDHIIAAHARELWNEHPSYEMEKARRIARENPPEIVRRLRAAMEAIDA